MAQVLGKSEDLGVSGVRGENTAGGRGVEGFSQTGQAVYGESIDQSGVLGRSTKWTGVTGESVEQSGVSGVSQNFVGVWGESKGNHAGVLGRSTKWTGVTGESVEQSGVSGVSQNFVGVWGENKSGNFPGVLGKSTKWAGVIGESIEGSGVTGVSEKFVGVWAESKVVEHAGLFAKGPRLAGYFEGDVEVTGDIRLKNADCAEDFDIAELEVVEPGTVMVIDSEGALKSSDQAYDKRVAGVISGAGNYKPGLILDKQASSNNRMPIALMGKVYCKVDASYGAIEVGDLLTTSLTPGHAMKADDPFKAFGAVIGKSLRPLKEGQGLIPILIALQ
jgi:hypothetical protein